MRSETLTTVTGCENRRLSLRELFTTKSMHSKKIPLGLISALALVPFTLMAGENDASKSIIEAPYIDPWADTIHPISNPTHFDLAIPQTQIHPIFIHNSMPGVVDTILGDVHVGGDYQVYALQVELALSDRLSLNATKDGYIDFNPESTLAKTEGFANIAAGVKYAWLYQPENQLASNIQLFLKFQPAIAPFGKAKAMASSSPPYRR